jgi:hypothetical protein
MNHKSKGIGLGIALGAALGVSLGVIAGHVALWLGLGVAIGMAIGSTLRSGRRECPECAAVHKGIQRRVTTKVTKMARRLEPRDLGKRKYWGTGGPIVF